MRKALIGAVVVVAVVVWGKDYLRNGRWENLLDRYCPPAVNAPVEYYWGVLLELSDHMPAALYRLQRVREKYGDTDYGARAWAERINILDDKGERDKVLEEGKRFLETFPEHAKALLIRKKLSFIEHGY